MRPIYKNLGENTVNMDDIARSLSVYNQSLQLFMEVLTRVLDTAYESVEVSSEEDSRVTTPDSDAEKEQTLETN